MSDKQGKASGRKRKKWPWVTVLLLVILLFALIILPRNKTGSAVNSREAKLEKGSLTLTVVGTGQLGYDEAWDLEIPAGLIPDQILVQAGDLLSPGDPLAYFDPLSIDLAIEAALDEIEAYGPAIQTAASIETTGLVRLPVAGRVKAIYGGKGDQVDQVYQDSGALLLLSLDGRMRVEFESSQSLEVNDKVNVILSGARLKEGLVESYQGGLAQVSLTDNGPLLGESVQIESKEGEILGQGQVQINRPYPVIASQGKISEIYVSENEKIASGRALFSLEDLETGAQLDKLLHDRALIQDRLDLLLSLKETATLTAPSSAYVLQSFLTQGEKTGSTSADLTPGLTDTEDSLGSAKAFSLAPDQGFVLDILVDELDILSVQEDQSVALSFDAIDGKTFFGKVSQVATQAMEGGGLAKFSVMVRVDADPAMRVGMSVTATITVDEKVDCLLLPVTALQESGGRVFVYTEKDELTGELGGERELVTGLSDGDRVEILGGLDADSRVFYPLASSDNLFSFSPPGHQTGRDDQETKGN